MNEWRFQQLSFLPTLDSAYECIPANKIQVLGASIVWSADVSKSKNWYMIHIQISVCIKHSRKPFPILLLYVRLECITTVYLVKDLV